jgi:c-di-GMP-binding flagellar brake protein YcgR
MFRLSFYIARYIRAALVKPFVTIIFQKRENTIMRDIQKIEDEKYISTLLNSLSKESEIAVSVHSQDMHLNSFMNISYRKKGELIVALDNKEHILEKDKELDILFLYQDVMFNFKSKVLETKGSACVIQKPVSIQTSSSIG